MNVFDYFFNCFSFIINILDHDFFGFGFSYLDFFLAVSLILVILRFLLQGFNESDRTNFFSFMSIGRDFSHDYKMKNNQREKQVTMFITNDLNTGKNTVVKRERGYIKDKNVFYQVDDKYKF